MAIGTAIAQGLLTGLGEGTKQYFNDQRRQRLDDLKMKKSWEAFTKQADYSFAQQQERDNAKFALEQEAQREQAKYAAELQAQKEKSVFGYKAGMEDIATKNTQLTEWERVSKMNVNDIVYENAISASKTFAPTERSAFIRDYLNRKKGVTKAQAINDRGLTLPDYSKYKDNPDIDQSAIPVKRLAGVAEMPDADSMFSYDVGSSEFLAKQKETIEKLDKYDKSKIDALSVIKDSTLMTFQAEPSESVALYLWQKRGKAGDVEMKGAEVISHDNTRLAAKIASGDIVKIDGMIKMKRELNDDERSRLNLPPLGAQGISTSPTTPTPKQAGLEYVEPQTKEYLDTQKAEKEAKAMDSAIRTLSKDLGTGKGTPLTTYTELGKAITTLDSLDEDALDYLFSAGFSLESVRDVRAKYGSKAAQQAKDLISQVSGSVNAIRHELFGSALTEGETESFRKTFSDIGALNTKDNLKTQLRNLMDKAELGVAEKMAGYTPEQRQEFLNRNPSYAGVMERVEMPKKEAAPTPEKGVSRILNAQGSPVTDIPDAFWSASPATQARFLEKYNYTMGG